MCGVSCSSPHQGIRHPAATPCCIMSTVCMPVWDLSETRPGSQVLRSLDPVWILSWTCQRPGPVLRCLDPWILDPAWILSWTCRRPSPVIRCLDPWILDPAWILSWTCRRPGPVLRCQIPLRLRIRAPVTFIYWVLSVTVLYPPGGQLGGEMHSCPPPVAAPRFAKARTFGCTVSWWFPPCTR